MTTEFALHRKTSQEMGKEPAIDELSSLEAYPPNELHTLLARFDRLLNAYSSRESDDDPDSPMQNTQKLKAVVPKLPSLESLMSSEGNTTDLQKIKRFKTALDIFKKLSLAGSDVRAANPNTDLLKLDETHPEILLAHYENTSPEALAFATTLHIIEEYFNHMYAVDFEKSGFDPRKDWFTDVCLELMIANETLPSGKRDEEIHKLFDLLNNQMDWIKGYPNINPALREVALLAPLAEKGIHAETFDATNFATQSKTVEDLVRFDQHCFGENPTGSAEHAPPLLTAEDVVTGVKDHANQFVILRQGEDVAAVLQTVVRRGGDLHIISLGVRPENRGQGIGTLLLDWVDAEAERLGIHEITLRVDPANEAALSQYLKHGYIVVGLRNGTKHFPNLVTLAMTRNLETAAVGAEDSQQVSLTDIPGILNSLYTGLRGVGMDNGNLEMQHLTPETADVYPTWS